MRENLKLEQFQEEKALIEKIENIGKKIRKFFEETDEIFGRTGFKEGDPSIKEMRHAELYGLYGEYKEALEKYLKVTGSKKTVEELLEERGTRENYLKDDIESLLDLLS